MLWDLAVHDLSIMDCVLPDKPVAISATGISHVPGQPENVAYITLFFPSAQIAHVHVNWLTPVKVRHTLIGGSEKMILYDDLEPTEKVKIYDRGVTVARDIAEVQQMRVGYRIGDMYAPTLESTEALAKGISHFEDCIREGGRPDTDGENGTLVVEILEAASKSVALNGHPVSL